MFYLGLIFAMIGAPSLPATRTILGVVTTPATMLNAVVHLAFYYCLAHK
jgi:hypothetical protein